MTFHAPALYAQTLAACTRATKTNANAQTRYAEALKAYADGSEICTKASGTSAEM
jgi:hypothetical protein